MFSYSVLIKHSLKKHLSKNVVRSSKYFTGYMWYHIGSNMAKWSSLEFTRKILPSNKLQFFISVPTAPVKRPAHFDSSRYKTVKACFLCPNYIKSYVLEQLVSCQDCSSPSNFLCNSFSLNHSWKHCGWIERSAV